MTNLISHKYTKFRDLPGESDEAKIQKFISTSINGAIVCQEKINGVSFRYQNGRLSTRTGKEYKRFHFPAVLWDELISLNIRPTQQLIGEMKSDNLSFQDLGRAVAVNRTTAGDTASVYFVVYDIYDTSQSWAEQSYTTRQDSLDKVGLLKRSAVRVLSTIETNCPSIVINFYNHIIARNGEGIVMIAAPYCINNPDIRVHPDIVKWKKLREVEGKCVSVFEGKGKRKGMLGSMLLLLPNGKYVLAGGGESVDDNILTNLLNNPPIGRQITITYEDESTSGVPLRPQIKGVRDYE